MYVAARFLIVAILFAVLWHVTERRPHAAVQPDVCTEWNGYRSERGCKMTNPERVNDWNKRAFPNDDVRPPAVPKCEDDPRGDIDFGLMKLNTAEPRK